MGSTGDVDRVDRKRSGLGSTRVPFRRALVRRVSFRWTCQLWRVYRPWIRLAMVLRAILLAVLLTVLLAVLLLSACGAVRPASVCRRGRRRRRTGAAAERTRTAARELVVLLPEDTELL